MEKEIISTIELARRIGMQKPSLEKLLEACKIKTFIKGYYKGEKMVIEECLSKKDFLEKTRGKYKLD